MLHYLAVHDFVWINNTVTGRVLDFDYEALEACMAAQYGYGESLDADGQAANMAHSLLFRRPFEYGNRRTAFIALATFLTANRRRMKVDDRAAADAIAGVAEGAITAREAVSRMFEPSDVGLRPGVTLRALVAHICNEHLEALKLLAAADETHVK